ncbi:MAG: MAPEG family protein [Bacteroidota bacterium]
MITPLYAAIAALIFIVLSFRTLLLRRKLGIAIGTGDNQKMERAIGVHSNFAEYTPITLLLIFFLESQTGTNIWIHVLCLTLIIGRLLHAYGVSQIEEDFRFRVGGMILTLGCLIFVSVRLIVSYVL